MKLPPEILDDRVAIVGTSGSGKTVCGKLGVEALLEDGARVCIVDALGVWYGLRSNAAGTGPGFPITIFGGQHGDLPLTENAGEVIAEAVATGAFSCIVDLSELPSQAKRRRFMQKFAETLYAKNKEPLHLILDEADLWAPQKPLEDIGLLEGETKAREKFIEQIDRAEKMIQEKLDLWVRNAFTEARGTMLAHQVTRERKLADGGARAAFDRARASAPIGSSGLDIPVRNSARAAGPSVDLPRGELATLKAVAQYPNGATREQGQGQRSSVRRAMMTDMFPIQPADIPLHDQIGCVRRELGMREKVYPRWVAAGKLKQATADAEIARMRAVLATLEGLTR